MALLSFLQITEFVIFMGGGKKEKQTEWKSHSRPEPTTHSTQIQQQVRAKITPTSIPTPPKRHIRSPTCLSMPHLTCYFPYKGHWHLLPIAYLLEQVSVLCTHQQGIALLVLSTPQLQNRNGWITKNEVFHSNNSPCWFRYLFKNITWNVLQWNKISYK